LNPVKNELASFDKIETIIWDVLVVPLDVVINDDDCEWDVRLEYTTRIGDSFPDKNTWVDRDCSYIVHQFGTDRSIYSLHDVLVHAFLTTVDLRRYHSLIPLLFQRIWIAQIVYLNTFFWSKLDLTKDIRSPTSSYANLSVLSGLELVLKIKFIHQRH
jgi:hypothetical protein